MGLTLVIVSDLHAGVDHPVPELRTKETRSPDRLPHSTLRSLREAIAEDLAGSTPDERVLLCAGDLADTGQSAEIEKACTFLETLSHELEIPTLGRGLIPGNHDIDRPLVTIANSHSDGWYLAKRLTKFTELARTHAPSFVVASEGIPAVLQVASCQVRIHLLDSPYHDPHDVKPHHGRLGTDQLNRLDQELQAAPAATHIVALHHHVGPMPSGADRADFSQLLDADELIALARNHNVRLIIHGHRHRAKIDALVDTTEPITVLGSGSTTIPVARLPYRAMNTYHVVQFESLARGATRGFILSRVLNLVDGWQRPKYETHGLEARRPFAPFDDLRDLESWAADVISTCLLTRLVKLDVFLRDKGATFVSVYDLAKTVRAQLAIRSDRDQFEFSTNDASGAPQLQLIT